MPLSDKRRSRNGENAFRMAESALETYRKSSIDGCTAKNFRGNANIKTDFFFPTQLRYSRAKNFKIDFVSEVFAPNKILLVYSVSS
jgi:hypothetical protein